MIRSNSVIHFFWRHNNCASLMQKLVGESRKRMRQTRTVSHNGNDTEACKRMRHKSYM